MGILLVGRSGVLSQDGQQPFPLGRRDLIQQRIREEDFQRARPGLKGESSFGIGVGVGIGKIGLNVVNRGPVDQIRTGNMQNRPFGRALFDLFQAHAGKADAVGPKGGSGGENPHSGVAAQTGRADGGGPIAARHLGKLPDQPNVRVALQTSERVGISKGGLEDNGSF